MYLAPVATISELDYTNEISIQAVMLLYGWGWNTNLLKLILTLKATWYRQLLNHFPHAGHIKTLCLTP